MHRLVHLKVSILRSTNGVPKCWHFLGLVAIAGIYAIQGVPGKVSYIEISSFVVVLHCGALGNLIDMNMNGIIFITFHFTIKHLISMVGYFFLGHPILPI